VENQIGRLAKQPEPFPDQPPDLRRHDAVTGLLNRSAFLDRLEQLLSSGRAAPGKGGVLFVELDNPRKIHDKLSITGTDHLLREIGKRMAPHAGPDDVLARFGDYSFAMAVCARQVRELLAFAEQLRQEVEEHLFCFDGPSTTVTLSVGVSFFDGRVTDAQRLLVLSEKACWIAAETGGNCVHAHKEIAEERGDNQDAGGLMGMLQEALATDGFQLFFQPIVGLRHKRAGHLHQVLLRMGAQQDEFQQAQDFIPVAERLGMMADLDRWVVEHTLRFLKHGAFGSPAAPQFLIALSQSSLATLDLADWLEQKLKQYGVNAKHFNFALRFADLEAELKTVERQIFRLRRLGARITLTDFGEAPGGFNYLRRILVDYLRVPMGWVDRKDVDLGEVVRKAHERHKSIIVPGVEAPRHMDLVWGSGADFVQGYFIQRPQARPDFDFSSLVLG
jgi:diguanylate cyclase (GGDEF)-like protein